MSLPSSWIDSLFARLSVRYGAAFMRQYADLDAEAVKADWAEVLGGFYDKPQAIRYGLEQLPSDKPVSALSFRDLCRRAPLDEVKALPHPIGNPSKDVIRRIDAVLAKPVDYKAWARRLRDVETNHGGWLPSGAKMTGAQREMWRTALSSEAATEGVNEHV